MLSTKPENFLAFRAPNVVGQAAKGPFRGEHGIEPMSGRRLAYHRA